MNYVKSLIVKFENELSQKAIPMFRGAVIAADNNLDDILFHSHDDDELRYAYPLIQYKTINGRAAIIGRHRFTCKYAISLRTHSASGKQNRIIQDMRDDGMLHQCGLCEKAREIHHIEMDAP